MCSIEAVKLAFALDRRCSVGDRVGVACSVVVVCILTVVFLASSPAVQCAFGRGRWWSRGGLVWGEISQEDVCL